SGSLTVTLTATSVTDQAKQASATVTVPAISLSVSPASATVNAGFSQQLTATVSGDPANGGVTWSVSCGGANCGGVSPTSTPSGVATTYTAPATAPSSNLVVTVTATSVTDGSKNKSASITVPAASQNDPPTISSVAASVFGVTATITWNTNISS